MASTGLRERNQVGVVPWRLGRSGHAEVLLITNRRGDRWTVPKGNVPRRLTPTIAAAREAFEEAGLLGPIGDEVGVWTCRKGDARLMVTLFALRPIVELPIWPEMKFRRRAWLPLEEAVMTVHHAGLRRVLARMHGPALA